MKIYVGNLSYAVQESDLQSAFAEYGNVVNVSLVTDRHSGQSKGFGFLEMPNNSEADKALKALNGAPFMGRPLKANQAEVKKNDKPKRRRRF